MEHYSLSIGKAINTFESGMTKMSIQRAVWRNPVNFIAFGFGAGLLPVMPGTWGTLIAIPFYLMLQYLPWQFYMIVVLVAFVVGIWICDFSEKEIGIPDYSGIVWDEVVGFWITLFLVPPGWHWIFFGFVLFRLLDVIKPWPISWFNKNIHSGFGIMFDDFLAGVFSCLLLQIIIWGLHAFSL